jgi:hypothetical protein
MPDGLISEACNASDIWRGASGAGLGSSRFVKKLEQALQLTTLRAAWSP